MSRKCASLFLIAAMAAPGLVWAQAGQQDPQQQRQQLQQQQPQQQNQQQAQQGQQGQQGQQITISEELIVKISGAPTQAMYQAREAFLHHDYEEAAACLDAAGAFLRIQAMRADAQPREELMRSAQELDQLAQQVRQEQIHSVRELDRRFAQAENALAQHHYAKAREAHEQGMMRRAGHELAAAAKDVEHAAAWSGHELDRGTAQTLREARQVGSDMLKGVGVAERQVAQVINQMGQQVQQVAGWMEPQPHQGIHAIPREQREQIQQQRRQQMQQWQEQQDQP